MWMLLSVELKAQEFGIFEPRGLAMGGATVTLANTDTAQFYNPALLSFHDGDEDLQKDGSFYFPSITGQISSTVNDLIDLESEGFEDDLSDAINAFNQNQSADTAIGVVDSAEDLLDIINRLDNEDVVVDSFIGLSLTEPGDRQGGAFYFGVRAIGGGRPDITDEDQALLNRYVSALRFIATNGEEGEADPELFDENGVLIDPVDNITSAAEARGLGIVELGVSLSREYDLWGIPVAFGITPKIMGVRAYQATQSVSGGTITTQNREEDYLTFNSDFGIATEIASKYRIGLSVKDVISKKFSTGLGGDIRLHAKPRLGFGYSSGSLQFGMDVDLMPIKPLGTESDVQEIGLGAEWGADLFLFRLGYRYDLAGGRSDIFSLGTGINYGRFLMNLAYATGSDTEGAGIQIGFRH